ncbi:T9SS type A sorting domain-containing protein [Gracilimonas sediminicola]|uniref:T9SS type A sorting domain-containing protein n=1 Tax=Gracilimonas sediminicola TaxID=2952158 RepID=A0A9X2RDH5_9BACT|nr:T9SS type A sorting domain-containing protein [Gracilimonas sediminicola]MCP9290487.1 T9SS type A sorting domain-containing protein [Gracilimonas sediminicola]
MKKCLLILSLALFGSTLSFGQTTIKEAYFHELKGLEDSSGVTHLFYRLRVDEVNRFECNDKVETYYMTTNNVYHYSPDTSDTTKFLSYMGESCTGNETRYILDYQFYSNNPDKWISNISYGYVFGINDHLGNILSFNYPIVIKEIGGSEKDQLIPDEFLLSPNGDSLYVRTGSHTNIPFSGNGEEWPVFENYDEAIHYADSVAIEWNIIDIHPTVDSLYFGKGGSGHLYRSTNYTGNFKLADSSGSHTKLAFDADSSTIYSLVTVRQNSEYKRKLLISENLGVADSWSQLSIPETETRFEFITTDREVPNQVLLADSNIVYLSDNAWESFNVVYNSEDAITGLYKKPNSNLLYVLTRKELLEVNIQTKSVTSLKQIPVSNEVNQNGIPKQVILSQNYPNPFNPITVISYQLTANSLVQLEVFDVTGRKVAVLVNGERKAAGSHQVTFEAGNLASGVYFYRLETAGQTLTQKMLLVK